MIIGAMVLGAASAFGIAYRQWLTSAFGPGVSEHGLLSVTDVMSSWGSETVGSPHGALLAGGIGIACLLLFMVTRRLLNRRATKAGRWISGMAIAGVLAALLVGARYALGSVEAGTIGLPSSTAIASVLVAVAALAAGVFAGWVVCASSGIVGTLAGMAAGLVVAVFGQVMTIVQGGVLDARYMMMTGGIVLLSAMGGLVGSALAHAGGYVESEERFQ